MKRNQSSVFRSLILLSLIPGAITLGMYFVHIDPKEAWSHFKQKANAWWHPEKRSIEVDALTVTFEKKTIALSRNELLKITQKMLLTVDPTGLLGKKYIQVIPLTDVFHLVATQLCKDPHSLSFCSKFPTEFLWLFECQDGFTGTVEHKKASGNALKAYLAIEPKAPVWPKKNSDKGPFAIVWIGQGAKSVSKDQWPYGVVHITAELSLPKESDLIPDPKFYADHEFIKANMGAKLYEAHCLSCHRLSRLGPSGEGPDLNSPMNITDYFTQNGFYDYVRNPKSVRYWEGSKMKGFSSEQLTSSQLQSIWIYLEGLKLQLKSRQSILQRENHEG